jgi:uncharacterized protein (DUF1800 family)
LLALTSASLLVSEVALIQNACAQGQNAERKNLHLLNRISFGPTVQDIADLNKAGIDAYIRRQLNPNDIDESPQVADFVRSCDALTKSPIDLFRHYGPPAIMAKGKSSNNSQNAQSQSNNQPQTKPEKGPKAAARRELFGDITQQAISARLLREIESPRQLEEVMTDFWFNHFNVSIDKGLDHIWTGAYEQQAIRPYVLGKFRDLLEATSHHPAMLFYLDNWENTAPGSPGAHGNFTGLNENYARELMELHTLGVDGGYTQKDVTELARILTGLGLPKPKAVRQGMYRGLGPSPVGVARFGFMNLWRAGAPYVRNYSSGLRINRYGSLFDEDRHDFGDKVLLGHVIHGSGEHEIEEALDMLASYPATAHHISYELAQYFVSDEPPESLVNKLTTTFTQTDGDIKAVINTLLHSKEFWDPSYENCKYKSPLRYAVSVLRISGVHPSDMHRVQGFLNQQGMRLYGCLTPDGYKNTKEAWLNSGALLQRLSFATVVGLGRWPGSNVQQPISYEQIKGELAGLKFSDKTISSIETARPAVRTALILGSPEFMWY